MAIFNTIPPDTIIGGLPGETSTDPEILEDLLQELDLLSRGQGLEVALQIANCVLDRLFRGNPGVFRARSNKHDTFRALQNHEDLPLSRTALWYALAVRDQVEVLPDKLSDALPLSHHKVLLQVKDVDQKIELARQVARDDLSRRDLERVIRRKLDDDETRGRGRPRLPAVVKALRRLEKATTMAMTEPVDDALMNRLSVHEIRKLILRLDRELDTLGSIREQLACLVREEAPGSRD